MSEVFEGYSDTFEVVTNPYGIVFNFNLSPANVRANPTEVARIRVSFEMAKVLTFLLLRLIKKREEETAVSYPIPVEVLNNLKIPKEDWDTFWRSHDPLK